MAARLLFIVNPTAGGGRLRDRLPRLRAAIERHGLEPEMVFTERQGHGYDLARRAITDGSTTLVACGGDGTLFETANAIMDLNAGERVRLGVIPVGTGNDVSMCLGVGSPAAALRAIAAGSERIIDAGRLACVDADGRPMVRHFLLVASAGWIPEIAHSVPFWLKRMGKTSPYIIMTVLKMLGPMNRDFRLTIDGRAYDSAYNSVSIHNVAFWGGDLEAVPGADPGDGVLDVVRWGALGRRVVVSAIQGQRRGGTHLAIDGIDHHQARVLQIDSPKRTQLDLDGEVGGFLPATIEVVPGALRFLAPPAASEARG